uniref:citramalyl-CoA lyase, mitochondrial isoform X1 n=2 Tax=Myxine glutinosa TaxID=7769 RepID=UPI0035902EC8
MSRTMSLLYSYRAHGLNIVFPVAKRIIGLPCISLLGSRRHQHSEARYVPRRAVLYVPGDDQHKISKLPGLHADCTIMDCEDGVAQNRKEVARETIRNALTTLPQGGPERTVRLNSVASGIAEEDLRAILSGPTLPPTLLLPKVDTVEEIRWFADQFSTLMKGRSLPAPMNLITYVESAMGLLNFQNVCEEGLRLGGSAGFCLVGTVFGSDDFCASVGTTRTADAHELLYTRQKIVTTAKAYGLQAIDLVYTEYKDEVGLERQAQEGALMGFTGKQVIHPGQINAVQKAFSPSARQLDWARELISTFEEHQKLGKGAFTFRGSMIDMPVLRQARNVLALALADAAR